MKTILSNKISPPVEGEDSLQIHNIITTTKTMGPFKRCAIWVQGCELKCEGCMSPSSRPFNAGKRFLISQLAQTVLQIPEIEGITVSGGEPFLQAKALAKLFSILKKERNIGIIVYTGCTMKTLIELMSSVSEIHPMLQNIDLLIDGPYKKELNDGGSLRGSSNQQIHSLSSRYTDVIEESYHKQKREVEFHLSADKVILVGIPGKDTLIQWKSRLHQ